MDRTTDPVTHRSDDSEAIARDISRTRADMSETVDALGDRLDPGRLAHEAKDALTSRAHDLVDQASDALSGSGGGGSLMDAVSHNSVVDTIKANPLPAAAVGLSVAWFLSKLGESEADRHRRARYAATGDPYYAPGSRAYAGGDDRYLEDPRIAFRNRGEGEYGSPASGEESMKDKASDALHTATDKAGGLAHSAQDAASDAAHAVHDRASHLADRAGSAGDHAQQRAREAGRQTASWLERQMHESPLLVGAVALAGGALVGLALPETQAEDRLIGDEAARAKQRALDVAADKAEDVRDAAADVADEATDKAKDVADSARGRAEDVAETAKDDAGDVVATAQAEAKDAAANGGSSSTPATGSSVDMTSGRRSPTPVSGPGTTQRPSGLGSASPDETVDLTSGATPSEPSQSPPSTFSLKDKT